MSKTEARRKKNVDYKRHIWAQERVNVFKAERDRVVMS